MSKIVRVQDGDYKIIVGSTTTPGNIILDTNPAGEFGAQGNVTITGNLTVLGNTTVIESETLSVKDNIIYINEGETGSGVSILGSTAGIRIDRGTEPDVNILWDESLESFDPTLGLPVNGTFKLVDVNGNIKALQTNSINTDGGDLALVSDGTGVVTVKGTVDYEQQVLDYTKLYTVINIASVSRLGNVATINTVGNHNLTSGNRVDVVCLTVPSFNTTFSPITVIDSDTFTYTNVNTNLSTTTVTGTVRPNPVIDDDTIPNIRAVADYAVAAFSTYVSNKIQENDTSVITKDFDTSGVSEIEFKIDGTVQSYINNNGLHVDNININNNNIINTSGNDNIFVDSLISVANKVSDPFPTAGYVTLYSKSQPGTGGTGLYFVNPAKTDDELISKTKAILYSLIL